MPAKMQIPVLRSHLGGVRYEYVVHPWCPESGPLSLMASPNLENIKMKCIVCNRYTCTKIDTSCSTARAVESEKKRIENKRSLLCGVTNNLPKVMIDSAHQALALT